MRFGLQLTTYGERDGTDHWALILGAARAADESGYDSLWFPDHFMFYTEGDLDSSLPTYECFVTLGALAAATERVRLGPLVVGVPYRNVGLLAKACATLDGISGGRSIVGLGAGWQRQEFEAYGWPFGTANDRADQLEEAVQIVARMLSERPVTWEGERFTVRTALNDPPPVQRPRPPILVGGGGERRTLRIVARYADMCNVSGDPEQVRHKYDVLRRHCEEVGRPPEEVVRSNDTPVLIAEDERELARKRERFPGFPGIAGTPEQVVERLRAYAAAGSQYVTLGMPDAADVEPIRLFGERVIPALADA